MIYVLAVIAGIIGAVVGWGITAMLAAWIAGLFGMSDFEGARGMFAAFFVGPMGGFLSMVGSIWMTFRIGKGPAPWAATFARVAAVLAAIALLVTCGIWVRLQTIDTYTNSVPPFLAFEIGIPVAIPVPQPAEMRVELHTDKNVGEGLLADHWSAQDDRNVLAGSVSLDFKTSARLLVVASPGQPTRLFRLALSRDPPSTATMGPWHKADHVDIAGESGPRAAPADDPVEIRYRVRRAGED
jgi:hypothetical protein